jgi:HEAT repeat protein
LLNALKSDSDRDVRCEAAESLGHLRVPETVEALIAAIDDSGVNSPPSMLSAALAMNEALNAF